MARYQVHFTRYNKQKAQRLNSAPFQIRADNMDEALRLANIFITGMVEGGCTDDVEVLAIELIGARGDQCHQGTTIWDTGIVIFPTQEQAQ